MTNKQYSHIIDCVPRLSGEYLKDILVKYRYVIRLDARNILLEDLQPIEAWCDEHFGDLDENSDTSPWQLSVDDRGISGIWYTELCFHFHNEQDAMAFKLRWL